LILTWLLLRWGYGDLHSSLALAPVWLSVAYGLALAAAAVAAAKGAASWFELTRYPYRRGWFLFPGVLVDTTKPEFTVIPVARLERAETIGQGRLRVSFEGGNDFEFQRKDEAAAERARERLLAAKRETLEADLKDDEKLRAQLDPLLEPRFSNPLAHNSPLSRPKPTWRFWLPGAVGLIALLLGVGFGGIRNTLSERRLYARAVAEGTPEALHAYLDRGGLRPNVQTVLLPTAELEALERQGSLEDLERYSQQHPDSAIRGAIDLAVRDALLQALTTAKEAKSISALDAFTRSHASHALVLQEVQAARRTLLARAAESFVRDFAAPGSDLGPFIEKALSSLAEKGPDVEVRFERIVPDSVAKADKVVSKDPHFLAVMLPSQYFDEAHSKAREEKLFQALEQRFSKAFAPDVLHLVHAAPLTPNAAIPDTVERPTLFISHSTNMGSGIGNLNPSGTFVGVGFLFKANFKTPGWTTPVEIKYSTWKPPDLLKLRKAKISIPDVYLSMADAAFGTFEERLVAWLFRS
jgi:hypothetical protein